MPVVTHKFSLEMKGDTHIENVTAEVRRALQATELRAGLVTVFVKHTTASVMIIEDEPGLRADSKTLWDRLIPSDPLWQHNLRNFGEDNAHSHLRGQIQGSSITVPFTDQDLIQGSSITVPFTDQDLTLGTWQEIVIVDFDTRARTREVIVQIMGE